MRRRFIVLYSRREAQAAFRAFRRRWQSAVWLDGAATGAGSAAVAVVLQLPPASLEKAAHHQRHRALLCGSSASYPAHGLLCERRKAWTGSSTPFSSASTWNGKTAPSGFLHKQLDVTVTARPPRFLAGKGAFAPGSGIQQFGGCYFVGTCARITSVMGVESIAIDSLPNRGYANQQ